MSLESRCLVICPINGIKQKTSLALESQDIFSIFIGVTDHFLGSYHITSLPHIIDTQYVSVHAARDILNGRVHFLLHAKQYFNHNQGEERK